MDYDLLIVFISEVPFTVFLTAVLNLACCAKNPISIRLQQDFEDDIGSLAVIPALPSCHLSKRRVVFCLYIMHQ